MSGLKHTYTLNENIMNKFTENRAIAIMEMETSPDRI